MCTQSQIQYRIQIHDYLTRPSKNISNELTHMIWNKLTASQGNPTIQHNRLDPKIKLSSRNQFKTKIKNLLFHFD